MHAPILDSRRASCFTGLTPAATRTRLRRTRRGVRTSGEPLERRVLLSVLYVDDTAAGPARDGASWASAYTDLQAALAAAAATPGSDEIRVAAGTYRPSARTDAADPRSATFSLRNGVSILGGFPDGGGASRDFVANVATLSGDLGAPGNVDNTYHVVTAVGVDGTALLDGLTVTGGSADGFFMGGGGMYNVGGSSPTLANCTISGNRAWRGGGMYNGDGSSPTLTNCTISGNSVWLEGGGMLNVGGSSPTLTSCTFTNNSAIFDEDGGGLGGGGVGNLSGSAPTLTNCTISGNSARDGGGMPNVSGSSPTLTNCTLSGNSAAFGGAVYVGEGNSDEGGEAASADLINCAFVGNSALDGGGGVFNGGEARLINCTFSGNSAGFGGGMLNSFDASARVTNNIFRGNHNIRGQDS